MSQALTPESQRMMTMTTTTMTMTTRGPPDDDDNDGNNDDVDADGDDVDEDAPPTAHLLSSDTVLARSPVRGGCWHSLDHPRPDQAVGKPSPGARRASGGWRRYGVLGQAVVHQPLRLLGSKPARHVSPPAYGGGPKSSQPQIGPYHQFSSSLARGAEKAVYRNLGLTFRG